MKNRDVSVSSAQGMHLSKTLNIVETVSLAASDISPTSGVFFKYAGCDCNGRNRFFFSFFNGRNYCSLCCSYYG